MYRYSDAEVLTRTALRLLDETAIELHLCHAEAKESSNQASLARHARVMDDVIQKEKAALDKRAEALEALKRAVIVLDGWSSRGTPTPC